MKCGGVWKKKLIRDGCGTPLSAQVEKSQLTSSGHARDEVFLQLKALLIPFGISHFYTDNWGAYERHLDASQHKVGKKDTQKIENKHINLRTRIKRLARKTICFSLNSCDA